MLTILIVLKNYSLKNADFSEVDFAIALQFPSLYENTIASKKANRENNNMDKESTNSMCHEKNTSPLYVPFISIPKSGCANFADQVYGHKNQNEV